MARITVQSVTAAAARVPGLDVRTLINTGEGAGLLLTTRGDSPDVLGLGAVDLTGYHAAIGMDDNEVRALRDALTDWLER